MEIKPSKELWKLSKQDHFFLGLSLLFLFFSSTQLYYDFHHNFESSKNELIGKVVIKENRAERKFHKQSTWENISSSYPLYNKDTLLTGENSSALILLNDGTQIDLNSKTMVILDLKNEDKGVVLKKGGLNIELDDNRKIKNNLKISSGSSEIEVSEGKLVLEKAEEKSNQNKDDTLDEDEEVPSSEENTYSKDNNDLALTKSKATSKKKEEYTTRKSDGDDELKINVIRGNTTVSKSKGKKIELRQNQSLKINKKQNTIVDVPVIPEAPQNSYRRFIHHKGEEIAFVWKVSQSDIKVTQIELSKDEYFRNKKIEKKIKENLSNSNSTKLRLSAGTYYWRLKYKNKTEKSFNYSASNKLYILEAPYTLIGHVTQSNLTETTSTNGEKKKIINFSWGEVPVATSYNIEISKDKDFKTKFYSRDLKGTYMSLGLPAGKYYWRYKVSAGKNSTPLISPINQLDVKKIEQENQALIGEDFQKALKTNTGEIDVKKIEENSKQLHEELKKQQAEENKNLLDKEKSEEYQKESEEKDESPSSSILLLQPKLGSSYNLNTIQKDDGLLFKWKQDTSTPNISYKLQMAYDKQFRNIVFTETTKHTYYSLTKSLRPGKYFWRIGEAQEGDEEKEIHSINSDIFHFKIEDASLSLVAPKNKVTFSPEDSKISFEWEELPYFKGKYELRLAYDTKFKKLFQSIKVEGNTYTLSKPKLHNKILYWEVRAFQTKNEAKNNNEKLYAISPIHEFRLLNYLSEIKLRDGRNIKGFIIKMSKGKAIIDTNKEILSVPLEDLVDDEIK